MQTVSLKRGHVTRLLIWTQVYIPHPTRRRRRRRSWRGEAEEAIAAACCLIFSLAQLLLHSWTGWCADGGVWNTASLHSRQSSLNRNLFLATPATNKWFCMRAAETRTACGERQPKTLFTQLIISFLTKPLIYILCFVVPSCSTYAFCHPVATKKQYVEWYKKYFG